MKWWKKSIHRYGGLQIREDDCSFVWQIPANERCEWVKKTDDCNLDSLIQYAEILFCTFTTEYPALFILGLLVFVLWLLYLFLILGTTADNLYSKSFKQLFGHF